MRKTYVFSPHIFVYKPQVNSVFSVFLRFILLVFFIDFFIYSLNLLFLITLTQLIFSYLVDILFLVEIVLAFYILSSLGEEFIDYDSVNLNYWDIDLVIFFRFFFIFFMIFAAILILYLIVQPTFWTVLLFYSVR